MPKDIHAKIVELAHYQNKNAEFAHLSLQDLVDARDACHFDLLRRPNVVATAVGRYRIRTADGWPNEKHPRHGDGVRRFDNSEIRPYSWPCILVLVETWENPMAFAHRPQDMVPREISLTDGRRVPVCVIEAPKAPPGDIEPLKINYPLDNIGPGHPVLINVQGHEYAATIACLVSDGHKVFALTNRHVAGEPGEVIYSRLNGHVERIGISSAKQLTRIQFSDLYPGFPGRNTYVNLDIGLIEIDDLNQWTAKVRDIGVMGPLAEFPGARISLSLLGCHVRGRGAASGDMRGEIHGLFYRYKTRGGLEYVSDLLIGPRTRTTGADTKSIPFATHPGDSGTLWLLEKTAPEETPGSEPFVPLAVQWGRNMLQSSEPAQPQSFALATLLSHVCTLQDVDLVRDWNLDQTDTWGAIGHFSIAARTQVALSTRLPRLVALMKNNALIISHDDKAILAGDFTGMGSEDFVPLADVPDFYWKPRIAKQGFSRPWEGPNHFADMDQEGPGGKTLLDLTKKDDFIDPTKWNAFYDKVTDPLSGEKIQPQHRGLLPFRVWQIFDAMTEYAASGDGPRFVCAAGVLTHYVGDACQPLHISYLHDGDPLRPYEYTFSKGKKAGKSESRPLGMGVHAAYEDAMVHEYRSQLLDALLETRKVAKGELLNTGFAAARATIEMMRTTFKAIPPADLVQTYADVGAGGKKASDALWKKYGKKTGGVMQAGAHLLGVLWESAWTAGNGEKNIKTVKALTQKQAMTIVSDPGFLPSRTISEIGAFLKK